MIHPGQTPAVPPEPTDLELVEQWRQGDERAARLLVARHAGALARFAAALGVTEDVEDLVQDTFVRAFASFDAFRGDSSLTTWLFTIERHLVLDRQRAASRRPHVALDACMPSRGASALDAVVAEEMRAQVAKAVARLGRLQREVFLLRVTEGMSYKDIAVTVGTTEGAARVHYHHAMRAIREQMKERLHD